MLDNDILNQFKSHLINHAVTLGEYAPGKSAHIMYDFREALLTGGYLKFAGSLLWNKIKKYNPSVIYGTGFGAVNLLLSTQIAAEDDGVYLKTLVARDVRKERNRRRLVEGPRPTYNERAVFIDDIMNTGSTIKKSQAALEDENIFIQTVAVAVLYDFWTPSGSRRLEATGMPVERIFTRHDFGETRQDPENSPAIIDIVWRNLSHNQWNKGFLNASPTIWQDKVYFANDRHQVFAHDIHTGEILWEYQGHKIYQEKGIGSKLSIVNGFLYFTSYDGTICKVDAVTGKLQWKKHLDMFLHSTPWIDLVRNQVYVATEGGISNQRGDIVCLDLETATTIWSFATNHVVPCSPILINDLVICGSNDHNLYALDPATGELKWMLENIGEVKGRATCIDTTIIITVERGKIYGIDFDGNILWKRSCGIMSKHQFLQVHKEYGLVYVANHDGFVVAFDKLGNQVWIRKLRHGCFWNIRLHTNELIVITATGDINVIDPLTGKKLKYTSLKYDVYCPCDFDQNYIAIASVSKGFFLYKRPHD